MIDLEEEIRDAVPSHARVMPAFWWGGGEMRSVSFLRWTFVYRWTGLKGSTARFRWGVLRGPYGGKVYAGPLEIVWGPR